MPSMTDEANVLIITVTQVEGSAVIKTFQEVANSEVPRESIDNHIYFNLGTVNGVRVFLTQSEMGASGLGASLLTVSQGIEALSPIAVIMVGIAFGIDEHKQTIGDILVTEQLRPYNFLQRVGTQDGKPQIIGRNDKPHASPWLINHFKSANLLWDGAKVHFGVLLTGESVVDNLDFRDQLLKLEPEAIGGEMEGAGLYVACQNKQVDWILIKSICDWADGKKEQDKENRQETAARNAAAFVLNGLQFAPLDGQKSGGRGKQTVQNSELPQGMTNQEMLAPALATTGKPIDYCADLKETLIEAAPADLEEILIAHQQEILIAHQEALKRLEVQAAGYTTATIPVHLKQQLNEKRQDVERLNTQLEAAPADLEEILIAHQEALKRLEVQAAGYTTATIPVHLKQQLNEKRQDVERLNTQLEEAPADLEEILIAHQQEILIAHQEALKRLEVQAAGYTTSTIPVHLKQQLNEKRQDVEKLNTQ